MYQHLFHVGSHDQALLGGRESDGMDAEPGVGPHGPRW